ncbi:hypothetical protein FA95DRAFT_1579648 [Auriscalpium vulgare]|uniref:Uncharacterized protein n=1 Tax=Auriscalpium vulgare TaxID=40419 RepID=A0ACB8S9D8_9AGAM|nr:hypothetical protein FA95DRAFT_1579648 [Auriscalpium vulgare]
MARVTIALLALFTALFTSVLAAPLALTRRAAFQLQSWPAGSAQAQAAAVFIDPFNGVELTTVDETTLDNMNTMHEAAEAAETDQFVPEISAASGAAATALQNGEIKNKVLKLTAEVQVLNIKIVQAKATGASTTALESSLTEETTKLNTNIALDKAAAGQPSKGVV